MRRPGQRSPLACARKLTRRGGGPADGDLAGEPDVAGGGAGVDLVRASGVGPRVVRPVLEAAGVEGDGDVLGLAGTEADPAEAAQVLRRFTGHRRLADVDLGHLSAGPAAGVRDVEADRDIARRVRRADAE